VYIFPSRGKRRGKKKETEEEKTQAFTFPGGEKRGKPIIPFTKGEKKKSYPPVFFLNKGRKNTLAAL